SGQAEGPGAVRRIQTGRNTIVERVAEWEPGSTLSYRIEGLPPVVKSVVNTWTITPTPTGSTVTLTSSVDAGSRPPQKLIARAVGRKLAEASEQMLSGLQEALA
ncbi:MAG: SRPBCC family protein, partial [Actinomycetia bacterium]|nr:SRPBCC family protein [Actinomycetes bacterium]